MKGSTSGRMDKDNLKLAGALVSPSYLQVGSQSLARRRKLIKALLSNRKLPKAGWDADTIELFIKASFLAFTLTVMNCLRLMRVEPLVP